MALLDEILTWTETLPMWQRDAARRLFQKNSILSQNDYNELYFLLKADHGLSIPTEVRPEPLKASHLPTVKAEKRVVLKTIRDLRYVNRIALKQKLNLSPSGMTIVYGGNASGKSGYSRVMKHACRTRGVLDAIYPDVNDPSVANCIPEAIFDLEIEGENTFVKWMLSEDPPDELATISIFDSQCARTYITAKQDIAYMPYGLDIVENLANVVINNLKFLLNNEINNIDIDSKPFNHLLGETSVGRVVASLNEKTVIAELQKLGTLFDTDINRLNELNKVLSETDPSAKAKALFLSATRIKELLTRIDKVSAWINEKAISKLTQADAEIIAANKAEKEAANVLQSGEKLLPGTGEKTWKMLFEAARNFSTEIAYPVRPFPNIDEGAVCPFCQQPIKNVEGRLKRFEEYIKNDIAKTASLCREKIFGFKTKIENANLNIDIEASLKHEIESFNPKIITLITAFQESVEKRRIWMLQSIDSHSWSDIPELAETPKKMLRSIVAQQLIASKRFSQAAKKSNRKILQNEQMELIARQKLSQCLTSVIQLVERLKHRNALKVCEKELNTKLISNKSKELSKKFLTKELNDALTKEFKDLGIGYIKTKLKEQSENGKYTYQLLLDIPVSRQSDKILSEGEQRAIAIGAFLAELTVAKHNGGIVFDDPVSSLDHRHRKKVAKRLALESQKRQILIFTHDIVFLQQLKSDCNDISKLPLFYFLDSTDNYCGYIQDGLPWDHKSVEERIDHLEKKQKYFEKLPWPNIPSEALASEIIRVYGFLRATVERAIQDVLFNDTVQRFRDYIDVKKLKCVAGILDDEISIILMLHHRCSEIIEAHDYSSAKNMPPPTPDELKQDLDTLRSLVENVRARHKSKKNK